MRRGGDGDPAQAEQWWTRAGDTRAMYNLGLLLERRGGGGDLAQAEDWYRRAADAGITGAMYDLGVLLERRGGDGDLAQAEQWWTRAAEDPRLAPQARNALATMRETRGRSK